MSEIARQALQKLLERGERAALKADPRAVTLAFTQASFPDYFRLGSYREKEAAHAVLREAERVGAIRIEWDPHAGDNGQIIRVRLIDAKHLAAFLGKRSRADLVREAEEQLHPWVGDLRVQEILGTWQGLRTVRGRDIHALPDLIDALRVLDYCRAQKGEDIAVRIASAALFHSSKRLEELVPWLDILTGDALQGLARPAEEVLAALGLLKHPPAVYLAGPAELILRDGSHLSVPKPFVGLASNSVMTVKLPDQVRAVLTVENLTPFHELAAGRAGVLDEVLVVYTAGMPAPSFLEFYRSLLHGARTRKVLHWGDIDPGGFRIARKLACAARESGVPVCLWQMCADAFDEAYSYRALKPAEVTEMQAICAEQGWTQEAEALARRPLGFEQEALPLKLP